MAENVNVQFFRKERKFLAVLFCTRFELRKWPSNTPAVLQSVPKDFRIVKSLIFSNARASLYTVIRSIIFLNYELHIDLPTIYIKLRISSLTTKFVHLLGLFIPVICLVNPPHKWGNNIARLLFIELPKLSQYP